MAIYRMSTDAIQPVESTSFAALGIKEREDLQRLLRDNIGVISPDLLVVYEEFCDWSDSKRRIDLLAIDRNANIVVIELKRTVDGGHMELRAIRYAAMIANLQFEQVVDAFDDYMSKRGIVGDAESTILNFLGWDEPDEAAFGNAVRIILASAEFSQELTTTVLWLNNGGMDISCVRLKPYGSKEKLLLDIQQVIPLPEASDYQIKVAAKQQQKQSKSLKPRLTTAQLQKIAEANSVGELYATLVQTLTPYFGAVHTSPNSLRFKSPHPGYKCRVVVLTLHPDESTPSLGVKFRARIDRLVDICDVSPDAVLKCLPASAESGFESLSCDGYFTDASSIAPLLQLITDKTTG